MVDTFNKKKRSEVMRAVKSSGNVTTELLLISIFRKFKLTGWRRKYRLYGKPDFVFPRARLVVFADGCFWHGHGCRNTKPASNRKYWENKISRNKRRDIEVNKVLRQQGWKIIRIWECEISKQKFRRKLLRIMTMLA